MTEQKNLMRVQKYLSQKGIMSRREAERAITLGRIKVNGKILKEMGVLVDPERDKVEVLGVVGGDDTEKKITVAVYKPRGVVCSENSMEGKTIFEAFPQYKNLNVVGRLDKESEGLLLMSNDGVVTSVVTGSDHVVPKEYVVTVREELTPRDIRKMEDGIFLDGEKTLPAKGEILGPHKFSLVLREGKTHQIRRMTDFLRLTVERLIRTRVGDITLTGLGPGAGRELGEREVADLKKMKFEK